eukprot:scaffold114561_cov66-Phaeocystis_antarctica.AAC.2
MANWKRPSASSAGSVAAAPSGCVSACRTRRPARLGPSALCSLWTTADVKSSGASRKACGSASAAVDSDSRSTADRMAASGTVTPALGVAQPTLPVRLSRRTHAAARSSATVCRSRDFWRPVPMGYGVDLLMRSATTPMFARPAGASVSTAKHPNIDLQGLRARCCYRARCDQHSARRT